jgi:ferredoxin-NADP reductase
MPTHHDVELLEVERCGTDVLICTLARPSDYSYKAGQWFRLTLMTAAGESTETFSLCSAPSDPHLEMATRLSGSPFKAALGNLRPGDRVTISAPGGRLALPAYADRVCFLAGGVGITPVRSLLRGARETGRRFEDALLLYANRDESCVPFADEFPGMGDLGVRMVLCFENPTPEWSGERGLVTAEIVSRHVDPSDGRVFLVAGPPVMVAAMERVLDELRVPDEMRIIEHFGAPVE